MQITVLPSAYDDLLDGVEFYLETAGAEVAQDFYRTLTQEFRSLLPYAGTHGTEEGYFKARSKRFPYGIFYEVRGDALVIARILDLRRDPETNRGKLR